MTSLQGPVTNATYLHELFSECVSKKKGKKPLWPRRDLNTQPSDLESDALPLRHGVESAW